MIRSFDDAETETFFKAGKLPRKKGWAAASKVAKRKLDMLHYAKELGDLRSPPGNCLESLVGDLHGYHSIRINEQWRVIFRWDGEPCDVKIADYH